MPASQDVRTGHWTRDLVLLTVLVGLLFGIMLGTRALGTPDEARYSEIPREMVVTGNYVTPRLDGVKYFEKPALFYWLQAASIRLFGLGEWSMRLWTATFGLLGVLGTYVTARRLYDRRTGLLAAAVLATSLLYFAMAHIVTLDMAVSVLMAGTFYAFLLGLREPLGGRRRWLLYLAYVLAALATLTKGLMGIVLPAFVIGVWIIVLWDWRLLARIYLPSGLLLFLLVAAPWHILVSLANPEFPHFYFVYQHFDRFLTKDLNRYQPAWYFIPILLLGLYPWTVFLPQALRHNLRFTWRRRHEHRDTLFLVLWAVLIFAFFSASDSKLPSYILPIFPPLAILLGRYFADVWTGAPAAGLRAGWWTLLLSGLALAAGIVAAPHLTADLTAPALPYYLWAMGLILAGSTAGALWLGQTGRSRAAVTTLIAGSAALLLVFNASTPLIVTKTLKPLALELKAMLKPGDEVVSYQNYFQDLPFYLQRRVTVAGYHGELQFGTTVEDDSAWIISDAEFFRRWNSPATVYAVVQTANFHALQKRPGFHYVLVDQTPRFVLLVNHGKHP